jgi:hypothetical protein
MPETMRLEEVIVPKTGPSPQSLLPLSGDRQKDKLVEVDRVETSLVEELDFIE